MSISRSARLIRGTAVALVTTVATAGTAVAAAPGPYVEPSRLGFGGVEVGSSAVDTVEVVNAAKRSLTITQAGQTTDFTFTGGGTCASGGVFVSLAPGASCKLEYRFAPRTAGRHSARLAVNFSDGAVAGFRLTGQGLAEDS